MSAHKPGFLSRITAVHVTAAAFVLALLLGVQSIAVGFCTDDYGFRAKLKPGSPFAAYDLFRFAPGSSRGDELLVRFGALPWWSAPDLKIHLIRPLSSVLFAFDDAVFGGHALGYHLHSIAWYLALLGAVHRLYRRLFGKMVAALALLVFAVSSAHVYPYAWVSSRHVLVGAVPAVLAILAHLRAREDAWTPGRWISPLLMIIGLLGSEAALAGVLFVLAYELLRRPRSLAACWPALLVLLVAVAYLVVYRAAGGGAKSSGGYHDPLANPAMFAALAATRLPILAGDALLGIPAEWSMVHAAAPLVLAGLAGALFFAWLYRACAVAAAGKERAALGWLVAGAVLATLVSVAGLPGGRVLLLPDIGFCALVGLVLRYGFSAGVTRSRGTRAVLAGCTALVAVVHLGVEPLSSLRTMHTLARRARATERIARTAEFEPMATKRIFVVAASDPMVFLYPRSVLAEESSVRRCWSVLSAAKSSHRLTRTGDRSFSLEPLDRALLEGPFETLFRAPERPLAVGDTVRQCGASVRVTRVNRGKPSRLEVTFDTPLDADDLALLVWREGRLRRFDLPATGASIEIPWESGPSRVL